MEQNMEQQENLFLFKLVHINVQERGKTVFKLLIMRDPEFFSTLLLVDDQNWKCPRLIYNSTQYNTMVLYGSSEISANVRSNLCYFICIWHLIRLRAVLGYQIKTFYGTTVCPGSSAPFYIVTYYRKKGHYFLDIQ